VPFGITPRLVASCTSLLAIVNSPRSSAHGARLIVSNEGPAVSPTNRTQQRSYDVPVHNYLRDRLCGAVFYPLVSHGMEVRNIRTIRPNEKWQ